ncbi:hypothetical protein NOR_05664 [Metarhizium rileyi]|uniref:Uncharacterized protein n=1 Tax=Metarhizium rileyi (strain RCEF 4871) TaxID=1649241 RepID=A0A167BYL5_METRR|nr:hypothetical protein NOR_05664 [Metarhizium rileyi RCEF 4871]TWU76262.1 hypothetical protein ED733_005071 [Metarhizium rileyi]
MKHEHVTLPFLQLAAAAFIARSEAHPVPADASGIVQSKSYGNEKQVIDSRTVQIGPDLKAGQDVPPSPAAGGLSWKRGCYLFCARHKHKENSNQGSSTYVSPWLAGAGGTSYKGSKGG